MANSYMIKIADIRDRMWKASNKADKASNEYNELVNQLEESERQSWAAQFYDDNVLGLRADMKSDTFRPLKSAYARYTFWSGQVQRFSALLVSEEAYSKIYERHVGSQPPFSDSFAQHM
jgi:hypothetical protein